MKALAWLYSATEITLFSDCVFYSLCINNFEYLLRAIRLAFVMSLLDTDRCVYYLSNVQSNNRAGQGHFITAFSIDCEFSTAICLVNQNHYLG